MGSSSRWLSKATILISIFALGLSGCATRKWVRQSITTVETRIDEVSNTVGRHENTLREHAERIDAVDRRAQQGITAAQTADQKAVAADGKAVAADRKADQANQGVGQANNRITALENRVNALGPENYVAGDAVVVTFRNNSDVLSDEAKSRLDGVANQVGPMTTGYFVEITGHTDDRGSERFNYGLSQRRSDSVQRYLVSKNVKLYRTQIVGLGEGTPVGPNNTTDGRQQNRRVEVRVYRAQGR